MLIALSLTINVGALATFVGSVAAFCVAVGIISRLRPVRWLWRRLVRDPFTEWFRREVGEIVDARLDARPILNGTGEKMIQTVHAVAEKVLDEPVS